MSSGMKQASCSGTGKHSFSNSIQQHSDLGNYGNMVTQFLMANDDKKPLQKIAFFAIKWKFLRITEKLVIFAMINRI